MSTNRDALERVAEALHREDSGGCPNWPCDSASYYRANARIALGALPELAQAQAAVERVMALAARWRYKGEFGWGPWQEGEGPDHEGEVLDRASIALRAALAGPEPTDPEREV